MLVLTRRFEESIMVGDDVVVTVVSIGPDKVRIGISAPRDTPVYREEVYAELRPEGGHAAAPAHLGR